MEIKRSGASKFSGWTSIVKEMPIELVYVDSKGNIELKVKDIGIPSLSGGYNVVVTLSPNDIGKILGEVYTQALTKSK